MLHELYRRCGVKRGEKIALIGKNTSEWITTFIGTITYGAVIVPILQEFNPNDVQHIVNHSGSVLMFCSNSIWENLDASALRNVRAVIGLDKSDLLAQRTGEAIGNELTALQKNF